MSGRRQPWLAVGGVMFGIGWGANQFVSLLIAYREHAHLSVGTGQALFGVYALGLIPTLLLGGPLSDRRGRAALLRPASALSVVATLVLMLGAHRVGLLYLGRFLAGVASGAVFAAGTAWVKELSGEPYERGAGEQAGARRAAVALSLGFGLGPVTAGLLAQWAPHPLVVPYLAHLAVMAVTVPALFRAPETVAAGAVRERRAVLPAGLTGPRFLGVVTPLGPWTFAAPSTAFAVLPGLVLAHTGGEAVAFAALAGGVALGTGVAVQPLARRIDAADVRGGAVGLVAATLGFVLAAFAAREASPALVVLAAVPLGAGYGFCLVAGLLETQRLADPAELAGLTAVFYALTYVGFGLPFAFAELNRLATYPQMLLATAGLAALTLAVFLRQGQRHPPSIVR